MKLLTHMIDRNQGWVRVLGVGMLWKHTTVPVLFSERNGYCRFWRIPGTPWRVRLLTESSAAMNERLFNRAVVYSAPWVLILMLMGFWLFDYPFGPQPTNRHVILTIFVVAIWLRLELVAQIAMLSGEAMKPLMKSPAIGTHRKPTHCYKGRCRGCGAVLASAYDMIEAPKETGEMVADMVRSGLIVAHEPFPGASMSECSCPKPEQPEQHWQPAANGRINLVTNEGQIVAYVQRLNHLEWEWDVLRYPNAYGRKRNKRQAQEACLADWKRCTEWTQG